jgi:hypothetical protein
MFTFLNPGLLVGLLAAAIPILIHLFTRRKVKTVSFSTLRFIKELQRRKIRYLKLRQILLLILRTLAVLFLVLAFARPALKQTQGILSADAPASVAVILDNSLSMGLQVEGQPLFEIARQRALEIVDLFKEGDEIYLIYPQRSPRLAHDGAIRQPQAARDLIESTELSDAGTDLVGAIRLAVEQLGSSRFVNREIYLISDLQRSGIRATVAAASDSLQIPEDVKLFVVPITGGGRLNLAIDSVGVVNQIIERGRVTEVAATVRNTGSLPLRERLIHLYLEGKRVGQDAVTLEPGATKRVLFRIVPDRAGITTGYARLEEDDLPQDNRRYFVFRIPEQINVLLVGNRPADTRALRLALRPDEKSATYIRVRQLRTVELNRATLSTADVVFLVNLPNLDDNLGVSLREFVRQGGGLVIFLGSDADVRDYNDKLLRRLEMPLLTKAMGSLEGSEAFLTFGKIDFGHPIFHGVFEEENARIESPRIRFAFDVARDTPHETIIAYGNGAPFLAEGGVGAGRVLLFTTALEDSWSDLPVRGIFAPLVNRSVTYLAGRGQSKTQILRVGSDLVYQPKQVGESALFAVEKPDGDQVRVKPDVSAGKYTIRFAETQRAGIYKVLAGERQVAAFAVNPPPEESDLTPADPDELKEITGTGRFFVVAKGASLDEVVRQSRYGRELWRLFLLAALACLLIEMLVFRERGEEEISVEERPVRQRQQVVNSA